jgi:hypothetical protein
MNKGEKTLMTLLSSHEVFTYTNDYRGFIAALNHGERCEIDEAMFIHWLEATSPLCMRRDVLLCDHREVRADFVTRGHHEEGALEAFWSRYENGNPADCRYFAQRAVCLI